MHRRANKQTHTHIHTNTDTHTGTHTDTPKDMRDIDTYTNAYKTQTDTGTHTIESGMTQIDTRQAHRRADLHTYKYIHIHVQMYTHSRHCTPLTDVGRQPDCGLRAGPEHRGSPRLPDSVPEREKAAGPRVWEGQVVRAACRAQRGGRGAR